MSDLDRDQDYYRKVCMIKENILPTQTEVKYRMGDDLAQALFDSILPALKPYLGLCPPLDGPGDDLWLSPSDLLIGKVKLKPPLTSKHVRALTHQGILDIGYVVEQKRDYEHQLDKEKALIEKEMIMKYMAAKELREAVARAKEEKEKEQEIIIAKLKEDFKEELQNELELLSAVLQIEQDKAVEAGKIEKEAEMQIKLDIAVQDTVCRLTEQFAKELYKVSKHMHEHFWYHIRKEKKKLREAIHIERVNGQENLEQLRTEIQCENIANIMYVLANERRRCICEKQAIQNSFIARLIALEKEQEDRNEKLQESVLQCELLGQKIKIREAILFDIIKQFQKFIYFVLRAVPTQAEYLINVEQLMIYELTRTVMFSKPDLFDSEALSEEKKMNTITSGSFEMLYSGSNIASTNTVSDSMENDIDASKKEYHNCENIERCDSVEKSLKENDDLPYFLFNENLYVREDFRNMISQGIKISKSHELWSFKNEDVINALTEENKQELTLDERINAEMANLKENSKDRESQSQKKSFVSVRFSSMIPEIQKLADEQEKILDTQIYTEISPNKEGVPKAKTETDVENEQEQTSNDSLKSTKSIIEETEVTSSKLGCARDSVDLLVEKTTKSQDILRKHSKTLSIRTQSSIISHTKKAIDNKLAGVKEIIHRRESKLETHTDSLELLKIKESVQAKVDEETTIKMETAKKKTRSIGVQCENYKAVGISHIEIIPEDSKRKVSAVSFTTIPKIIPDKISNVSDEFNKEPVYKRQPTEDRIYRIPSKAFKVIGDKDMKEHLQTQDVFTAKRVNSFIRIFKENPSLRNLFTEAAKN